MISNLGWIGILIILLISSVIFSVFEAFKTYKDDKVHYTLIIPYGRGKDISELRKNYFKLENYKMHEELESVKLSLQNANDMADVKTNPIVESVLMHPIKAIPIIGDMIDSSTNKIIEEFQKKKELELIDVILKDKHTITTEMVNDIEFIINYTKIIEAVRRLATNDKVKYFGNLIRNGYLSDERIDNNEFEEYLDKLNTMSYREIRLLEEYFEYCIKKGTNESGQFNYYGEFQSYYIKKYNITEIEVRSMFEKCVQVGFLFKFEKAANIEKMMNKEDKGVYLVGNDGYCIGSSLFRFRKMVLNIDE